MAPKLVSLDETFSVPELQQRTITRMSGSEIAAHNAAAEPLNIVCTETSAGFLKGHFYIIDEDGIIHDVFSVHDHSTTAQGGTLYDIKRANYKDLIEIDMSANIYASAFSVSERSVGTGGVAAGTLKDEVDVTANTKYVILSTAGTDGSTTNNTNDVTNGELGGGRIFFGKPLTLQLKYAVSNNTSIAYRMGCGTPRIETNVGTTAQLGFEGCTGTDTNNRVFSADGTTWSGEPLSNMIPQPTPIPLGLRIDWYPSSKIVATDGLGTVVTKISNFPPVGTATNAISTFRVGVSQLAPSASRWLKLYALRLVGGSYDPVVSGWL